ncbi:MFS transporter [Actinokineospora sp. G85]|uniref:MFS transporter n=1 Tax=Actinokineospora sp. G85 TaxID=3406626 RepID=UPI003C711E1B
MVRANRVGFSASNAARSTPRDSRHRERDRPAHASGNRRRDRPASSRTNWTTSCSGDRANLLRGRSSAEATHLFTPGEPGPMLATMPSTSHRPAIDQPLTMPSTTYTSVLAEPRFRVLFGCRSLAVVADTLRTVTLSLLVFTTTGSPLLAAVAFGIACAPQAVGGLLLGALADRVRPRPLIAGGYRVECACALLLARTDPPVWLTLTLIATVATITPVLTGDRHVLGRSRWMTAASLAQLVGLAAGGLATTALGPSNALLVSAVLHLTACAVTRLRLPDFPAPPPTPTGLVRQTVAVNRALLTHPPIRGLLLAHRLPATSAVGGESLVVGRLLTPGPLRSPR